MYKQMYVCKFETTKKNFLKHHFGPENLTKTNGLHMYTDISTYIFICNKY